MKTKRLVLISLAAVFLMLLGWAALAAQSGEEEPLVADVIVLDRLEPDYEYGDLYSPVQFNHMLHTMVVGDCLQCHHYFEHHGTAGVIVEEMRTEENCKVCHHMEEAPFEEPMSCAMCHQDAVVDYIEKHKNFACDTCHELDKSFDVRLIELDDGTIFSPPSLQGIYHQNCMVCHPSHRTNEETGEDELACDKCHKGEAEEKGE